MMGHLVLAAALGLAAQLAAAKVTPCTFELPINEMTTKADGIYKLLDGRQLKGTVHHVGGCKQQDSYPTGNPYKTNYTVLSYDSSVSSQECIDKKATDGTGIYDSFQAIVVEPNGFTIQPDLFVDDIDALETKNTFRGQLDSWRESSVVFGVAKGVIVHPELSLIDETLLERQSFTVPQTAMAELGLASLGEINVNGAQFSDTAPPHNCPFAPADTDSACRMKVKFGQPIEKLVILYAATHKANQDPNAVMFVSTLTLPCTCLCNERMTRGVKYLPVPETPGQCMRKDEVTKKPRFNCDMLASSQVCEYEYIDYMERTGAKNEKGFFACKEASSVTITKHQEYKPDANFVSDL